MMKRLLSIFLITAACISGLRAQTNLPAIELRLEDLGQNILNGELLEDKIKVNKEFATLLIETLKKPESFDYSFNGLSSISILGPEDHSFRIFTWYIVDKNYREYYGEQFHYYFGVVQRKYKDAAGKERIIVIPLLEMPRLIDGVENTLLSNNNWLGALYYPQKYSPYLKSFTRTIYDRASEPGKVVKLKQTFYLLMGWNGLDNKSNMKVVDVMSFDLKNPERVIFGADMFYFDPAIPKFRAVFRYSEYAPFTLNFGYVKTYLWNKKLAVVYDHLAVSKGEPMKFQEVLNQGPDGSYDALVFQKGNKALVWYKNVELAEKYMGKMARKERQEVKENRDRIQTERLAAGDTTATQPVGIYNPKKEAKAMQKQQAQQRKAEEARLKAAGIQLPKPPKENNENRNN